MSSAFRVSMNVRKNKAGIRFRTYIISRHCYIISHPLDNKDISQLFYAKYLPVQ
jgi:hypothetical protein